AVGLTAAENAAEAGARRQRPGHRGAGRSLLAEHQQAAPQVVIQPDRGVEGRSLQGLFEDALPSLQSPARHGRVPSEVGKENVKVSLSISAQGLQQAVRALQKGA